MTTATETRTIYNPIQRDWATFLELQAETGRTLIEVELAPGGGNDVHTHLTYDEHFECLQGELVVGLDGVEHRLQPGQTAVAPRGARHCFSNPSTETVRFLVELRPGHRGMEEALQVAYGLGEDGALRADGSPRNLLHMALLMEWAEVRVVGPMRAIELVLRPLGALARRRGIDAELRERYCRY